MQQQPPGYPPQGYQQQYGPPPGYPQQPPPKQGMSTAAKVLIGLGVVCMLAFGSCATCAFVGARGVAGASKAIASAEANRKVADQAAREQASQVSIKTLLAEYKDNELRADQQFKGRWVILDGTVGDVKKGIIGDSFYITLGTGQAFEIPVVQCFPTEGQESRAAELSKGARATVRGRVEGLMMNVLVKDCEIL